MHPIHPHEQQGKYTDKLGKCYSGEWVKHLRQGMGTESHPSGERYEGMWENNLKHGVGTVRFKNGKYREGYFEHGKRLKWISEEMWKTKK